ncbi:MAG: heme-binding protein [Actinomycetes bacterium]
MPRVNRWEMDLELASRMVREATSSAAANQALVSAAVVDAGGNLVAFSRMDGAEIAGPTLAVDKAYTATAHRAGTHELTELASPGAELAGLSAAAGGRFICFAGGLPLWDGNRVIGGIGVSGGTAAQDLAAAEAGLDVYLKESAS